MSPRPGATKRIVHPLNLLLISRDVECIDLWERAAAEVAVGIEAQQFANDAKRRVAREKYHAVVIDCETQSSPGALIDAVRKSPTNHHSVVIAIVNNTEDGAGAFRAGGSMCVEKRPSLEWVKRCLCAAHQTMVQDRRRHVRYPVRLHGLVAIDGHEYQAKLANISENGVG